MNGKLKLGLWALALVAVIVGSTVAYNKLADKQGPENLFAQAREQSPEAASGGETEKPKVAAPDFTAIDASGNEVKLSELIGERPVVLNFWASWCPPCKREMPDFQTVYEEMGDEIRFVMVDLVDGSGQETKEKGEAYILEAGFTFPVYYDINQEASRTYGISSIPTTFFIDKEGNLVTMANGAINADTLRRGISLIVDEE